MTATPLPMWWVYTTEPNPLQDHGPIGYIEASNREAALDRARRIFPEYSPESISVVADDEE